MTEFLRSDPELDAKIAACNSVAEISAVTKAHLAARGDIRRVAGVSEFTGAEVWRVNAVAEPVISDDAPILTRELKFDPASRRRTIILQATTVERLNELEAAILGYPSK